MKMKMKINFTNFRDSPSPDLIVPLVNMIKSKGQETIFVESGTLYGGTIERLKEYFDKLYSIELGKDLHQKAQARFAKEKHITILHGDSGRKMKDLLKTIGQANFIFWLDGHYSGSHTALGDGNTPITAELESIAAHAKGQAIILIDDMRGFLGDEYYQQSKRLQMQLANNTWGGYPSFNQLLLLIKKTLPEYDSYLIGDILMAVPRTLLKKITISPVVAAATQLRSFPDNQLSDTELTNHCKTIGAASGVEKKVFFRVFKIYNRFFDNSLGSYYYWWLGLIHQGANRTLLANYNFYLARRNGLPVGEPVNIFMTGVLRAMLFIHYIIRGIKKYFKKYFTTPINFLYSSVINLYLHKLTFLHKPWRALKAIIKK